MPEQAICYDVSKPVVQANDWIKPADISGKLPAKVLQSHVYG